jgi:hypothetical protein
MQPWKLMSHENQNNNQCLETFINIQHNDDVYIWDLDATWFKVEGYLACLKTLSCNVDTSHEQS